MSSAADNWCSHVSDDVRMMFTVQGYTRVIIIISRYVYSYANQYSYY